MPESLDFEELARRILRAAHHEGTVAEIAEELRLVWNARGAADIAKVDSVLYMEGRAAQMKTVDRALRSLDR